MAVEKHIAFDVREDRSKSLDQQSLVMLRVIRIHHPHAPRICSAGFGLPEEISRDDVRDAREFTYFPRQRGLAAARDSAEEDNGPIHVHPTSRPYRTAPIIARPKNRQMNLMQVSSVWGPSQQ